MQSPSHPDSRVASTGLAAARDVRMPAPTAWPIVLAFGMTLGFGGLVTSAAVTVVGVFLAAVAAVGWFRDVLPEEACETVPVGVTEAAPTVARRKVARLDVEAGLHRAQLPLEIYPVSAGIKGGLAGGAVMAVLAMGYGIVSGTGIWYPINLLSAGFFPASVNLSTGEIAAPVIWSGLLHSILGIVNPVMNQRIDWLWFVLSQVGFGVVAGLVVSRQHRVRTWQHLPLALRAGIEAPGLIRERDGEGPS
jgi:hypothetical protein